MVKVLRAASLLILTAGLLGCAGSSARLDQQIAPPHVFFVGGAYDKSSGAMEGAMYVERWRPAHVTQPAPLVLFHGAGLTGASWLSTPDGRPGWVAYFLSRGFEIYVVDQPMRGRSGWSASTTPKARFDVPTVERTFTASARFALWPQARLHSQWPGEGASKGLAGDTIFDAFYASTVPYLESNVETQRRAQAAGTALLDKIGPAILLTHSQAGAFGWLIADKRPELVKAIVAVEPLGPPLSSSPGRAPARVWGPTDIALTYWPAAEAPEDLSIHRQAHPDAAGLVACALQGSEPRTLPNLARTPVLILVGEASYHAAYDHCTAAFLAQAGVQTTLVRLSEVGIRGNGHLMMLEKNSDAIAAFIVDRLTAMGLARPVRPRR